MNLKFLKQGKTFIVAEAGVNHNGDMALAKRLIDVARRAGADAVKFQTFKAAQMVSSKAIKSKYQKRSTAKKESLYEMIQKLELNQEQHRQLKVYANKKGILFLSTPCDQFSVDLCVRLKLPFIKIASGDITNLPLLKYIAQQRKPVILSTGRSTLHEVREALKVIRKNGCQQIVILHCVSNYPAAFEDLNLTAMLTLKKTFHCPVGFSDHTLGIEASVAAVALGAQVIEKHFTLDRDLQGPDHRASLEPDELKKMVESIRNIETALGHGQKIPVPSEVWGRKNVRKGLISNMDIPKGTRLTKEMVSIKRPALGIEPKYLDRVIDKMTLRKIKKDHPIRWHEIEV